MSIGIDGRNGRLYDIGVDTKKVYYTVPWTDKIYIGASLPEGHLVPDLTTLLIMLQFLLRALSCTIMLMKVFKLLYHLLFEQYPAFSKMPIYTAPLPLSLSQYSARRDFQSHNTTCTTDTKT